MTDSVPGSPNIGAPGVGPGASMQAAAPPAAAEGPNHAPPPMGQPGQPQQQPLPTNQENAPPALPQLQMPAPAQQQQEQVNQEQLANQQQLQQQLTQQQQQAQQQQLAHQQQLALQLQQLLQQQQLQQQQLQQDHLQQQQEIQQAPIVGMAHNLPPNNPNQPRNQLPLNIPNAAEQANLQQQMLQQMAQMKLLQKQFAQQTGLQTQPSSASVTPFHGYGSASHYTLPTAIFTAIASHPKFSGSSGDMPAADWINQLEKQFAIHSIRNSHKWRVLANCLHGRAETFLAGLTLEQKESWFTVLSLFVEEFQNLADSAVASQQLEALQQGNLGLSTFADKFHKLNETAQTGRNPIYPPSVIRDLFFSKLSPGIKSTLLTMNHESANTLPEKWSDLLKICIKAENRTRIQAGLTSQMKSSIMPGPDSTVSFMAVTEHQQSHLEKLNKLRLDDTDDRPRDIIKPLDRHSFRDRSSSQTDYDRTTQRRQRDQTPVAPKSMDCFRCGSGRHFRKECIIPSERLQCDLCNMTGHIEQNCFKNMDNRDRFNDFGRGRMRSNDRIRNRYDDRRNSQTYNDRSRRNDDRWNDRTYRSDRSASRDYRNNRDYSNDRAYRNNAYDRNHRSPSYNRNNYDRRNQPDRQEPYSNYARRGQESRSRNYSQDRSRRMDRSQDNNQNANNDTRASSNDRWENRDSSGVKYNQKTSSESRSHTRSPSTTEKRRVQFNACQVQNEQFGTLAQTYNKLSHQSFEIPSLKPNFCMFQMSPMSDTVKTTSPGSTTPPITDTAEAERGKNTTLTTPVLQQPSNAPNLPVNTPFVNSHPSTTDEPSESTNKPTSQRMTDDYDKLFDTFLAADNNRDVFDDEVDKAPLQEPVINGLANTIISTKDDEPQAVKMPHRPIIMHPRPTTLALSQEGRKRQVLLTDKEEQELMLRIAERTNRIDNITTHTEKCAIQIAKQTEQIMKHTHENEKFMISLKRHISSIEENINAANRLTKINNTHSQPSNYRAESDKKRSRNNSQRSYVTTDNPSSQISHQPALRQQLNPKDSISVLNKPGYTTPIPQEKSPLTKNNFDFCPLCCRPDHKSFHHCPFRWPAILALKERYSWRHFRRPTNMARHLPWCQVCHQNHHTDECEKFNELGVSKFSNMANG